MNINLKIELKSSLWWIEDWKSLTLDNLLIKYFIGKVRYQVSDGRAQLLIIKYEILHATIAFFSFFALTFKHLYYRVSVVYYGFWKTKFCQRRINWAFDQAEGLDIKDDWIYLVQGELYRAVDTLDPENC